MKEVVSYLIVFVAGVCLGMIFSPKKTSLSQTKEQKELLKWERIKNSRIESAKIVYKKSKNILANLTSPGGNWHSDKNNISIVGWGTDIFDNGGLRIYYREKVVFDASNGFLGMGKVYVFHPGEWINVLLNTNIEREKEAKKIREIKKDFE